ncbi:MAG: FAD-dependent thymidylate synthase [bacterium]
MFDAEISGVRFNDVIEVIKPHVLFPKYQGTAVVWTPEMHLDADYIAMFLELCGRTCYKSEGRITTASAKKFLEGLIRSGHESVIEHYSFTVKFVGDRAMSHQLVRHRLGAYSQESQRYCDYGKANKLNVILPDTIEQSDEQVKNSWAKSVLMSYLAYRELRDKGVRPEDARSVLPNSTKTEIVATYNLRQWRHVFRERACSKRVQGQIRELTTMILEECKRCLPFIFFDFEIKNGEAIYRPEIR